MGLTATGSGFDLSWSSRVGMRYNVKSTSDLSAEPPSWTLVQGTVPYTYDDVGRRFRLSFAPVTGLYLKVVNEVSPPGAPPA